MEIQKLGLVYFSPTGTTQRVLRAAAQYLGLPTEEYDLTLPAAAETAHVFAPDELVLIGAPVYGGRVPKTMTERLQALRGDGTPAVSLVTYGARAYEDALLELQNEARENGFCPAGAFAMVAEHSVIRSVAAGRPDETDLAVLQAFCASVRKKLERAASAETITAPAVPGSEPYRRYLDLPMTPKVSRKCRGCGKCEKVCPVGAVTTAAPSRTDSALCIGCTRCIRECPKGARTLPAYKLQAAKYVLLKAQKQPKEPELFL